MTGPIEFAPRALALPTAVFTDDFSADRLASDYALVSGVASVSGGTLTTATSALLTVNAFDARCGDAKLQAKLNGGTSPGNMGLVTRYVDSQNFLLVTWGGGSLVLYKMVAGSFVQLNAVAFTPSNSTNYWMVAVSHGNRLRGEVWTAAPAVGSNPSFRATQDLSGDDESRFGAGRMGGVGLRLANGNGTQTADDLTVTAL